MTKGRGYMDDTVAEFRKYEQSLGCLVGDCEDVRTLQYLACLAGCMADAWDEMKQAGLIAEDVWSARWH